MTGDSIALWLTDRAIYLANGALAIAYFLLERGPHLISIGAALLLALTFDRLAQQEAVYAPKRYAEGAVAAKQMPRTAQVVTGVALALWLMATWAFGAPVPLIGAAMWAFG